MSCRSAFCAGTSDGRGRARRGWFFRGSLTQAGIASLLRVLLACLLGAQTQLVHASEPAAKAAPRVPSVQLSELVLIDDPIEGVVVSGQVQVTLSAALIQAIERGVPLRFLSSFQALQPRWWWWDRLVYSRTRSADLVFHPLTRQFRVTIDGATPLVYSDFGEALRASLAVKGWRVASPGQGIPKGGLHRIRLSLDLGALPKAIQVTALTSEQWAFDSGWSRIGDAQAP